VSIGFGTVNLRGNRRLFTPRDASDGGISAVPIYAFSGGLTRPMPQYAKANGRGITHFSFDDERGRLEPIGETRGIDDTAWLLLDPARNRLYATCEISGTDQSALAAYAVDPATGDLTPLGTRPAAGGEACHASLSIDGRFLFVANYNGATPPGWPDNAVSVFPLAPDGSLGPAVCSVRHEGRGPNPDRQTTAHAHCVIPSPDGRLVYVADLGIDRLVAYALGQDGNLTHQPANDFALPPGLGPRHVVFHPNGRLLFLVSELIPVVMSLAVDPGTGTLSQRASVAIEPPGGSIMYPAGIVLTPDRRFLFVSLRVSNEILGLAVDQASGALTETGRWPSGGATPRDLTFSPSGRHLIVANQDSDALTVFRVDQQDGTLSEPVQQVSVGTPMAIKLASFSG
jgi:6-phosphogluconolactonase